MLALSAPVALPAILRTGRQDRVITSSKMSSDSRRASGQHHHHHSFPLVCADFVMFQGRRSWHPDCQGRSAMARVQLSILGRFIARPASMGLIFLPTRKSQALLAYLALSPGHVHAREKLATLLWSERAEMQARQSLRQTLFEIRKAFARVRPEILLLNGDGVAANPAAMEVDAARFEALVAEGTPRALAQAVGLWEGELLEGSQIREEPWEEWLRAERARLRELRIAALTRLLTQQTNAGATQTAIQTAGRLLALDPLHEAVHRSLIRLYLRQGRRAEAVRQYQVCLEVLQRDLGVEPEAETRELCRGLLPRAERHQVSFAR